MTPQYFALAGPTEIGSNLFRKIEQATQWAESSAIIAQQERAYLYYFGQEYGGAHATSQVIRGGDQGELAEVRVNHSRALAQTLFNLIAASKIVWQPVATNSDFDSASQAVLAQNILEYYWQDRKAGMFCQRSLEESIPFCESFVMTEWDDSMGEPFAADELGRIVKTGDIRFTNVMSWDVLRDPRKRSYEELDWVVVRLRRNRFDLAAKHPELAQEILNAPSSSEGQARRMQLVATGGLPSGVSDDDETDIDEFVLLHKPTAALPEGLEVRAVSPTAVLKYEPLSTWPLHRVHHSELFNTPFAYSPYMEILGVQELMDSLETSIATNQSTHATQLIALQRGSNIDPDNLAKGMTVVYYDDKKPESINLTHSPQEVFAHLQTKKKDIEQLMGLNSVVRGEPLTGDQSGAALALLQAQAVQQSSGLQANYLRFVESVGNAVLELIRTRCPVPRRIAISGKSNKFLQREEEFTGSSIGKIRRVMVEVGNPMAQTAAGRAGIAQELLQNQLIKTPEQYIQVLTTGRLEPLTQSMQNELLLILKENEEILDGIAPQGSLDDDDLLHMREHRGTMASPDARKDEAASIAYQKHQTWHEQNYAQKTMNPLRMFMLGQEMPPMGPMGPPPGGPGAPPPEAGGPPPPAGPPGMGEQANLPAMPTDPSTGAPAPTPDGATLTRPGENSGPKGPGGM